MTPDGRQLDFAAWWAIFAATKLSALKKHCSKVTLNGDELANLVLFANSNAIGFRHLPAFRHHHPEHLELKDEDLRALATNGVGPLNERAQKTARKVDQMFKERRLFSGHLFWFIEDPNQLPKKWQFFHFDDKSVQRFGNHWKHGSHIHLMNHLTHPNLKIGEFWDRLERDMRPWLGGGLHVRFNR